MRSTLRTPVGGALRNVALNTVPFHESPENWDLSPWSRLSRLPALGTESRLSRFIGDSSGRTDLSTISQALASEVDLEVSLLSVLLDLESLLLLSPLLLSPSLLDDDSLSFFALSLYPSLR